MVVASMPFPSKYSSVQRSKGLAELYDLFGSNDPLGYEAGDYNFYRYVGNSPTNATDPSGLVGLPTDTDSPTRTIWESIRKKSWDAAKDLADDFAKCFDKGSAERNMMENLRDSIKQMKSLDGWRKKFDNASRSDKLGQLKTLEKTLKDHLDVRKQVDTHETFRFRYQIDYLKKLLGQ